VFDLREYTVGIIPFYAATTYLEENVGLNDFKEYQSLDEIINALVTGEIQYFAVVKSEYEGMYYVDKHYSILPKYTIKDNFDIAIAFPTDGEDTDTLISLYNKAIVLSNRSGINDEYFNIQIDLSTVVLKRTINIIIISVISIILVVSSVVFLYIKKISNFSLYDVLTKIKNRRALFNKTNIHSYGFLYYLDIDSFKKINDDYGHKIGDEILTKFCEMIQTQLSGELYRLGGDEFIFLSTKEYNKESFNLPLMKLPGLENEMKITLSVGALKIDGFDNIEIDELIILADIVMYKVKQSGKMTLCTYQTKCYLIIKKTSKSIMLERNQDYKILELTSSILQNQYGFLHSIIL